ncbi:hypothetical protein [Calothrix sp. UHCC 0171]|uniref:hypothetical protein n=1 Tax=Calothrix sp. UHCC 0171 TaxID=3110245 RepID=UPI002B220E43|nr:hypothetical protein [Calothrix sp. UHCC 0171]MEA5574585.1 hypothetical protein [Calothrix sp. UHCC 0171]
MTTYTKRIQSRLNRMGIKKSLAEIREVYTSIVDDKNNPTEEEITAVIENFMKAMASATSEVNIAAIETTEIASELTSELTTIQSSDDAALERTDEQQSPIIEESDVDEILQSENSQGLEASYIVVNTEQKQDLITTQASVLGIELSSVEVLDLATSIGDRFSDYTDFIQSVSLAIKSHADQRYDSLEQQIKNTSEDLKNHFEYREKQLNQKFAEGLGNVKTTLIESRKSIKSAKATILSQLKINST